MGASLDVVLQDGHASVESDFEVLFLNSIKYIIGLDMVLMLAIVVDGTIIFDDLASVR